MAYTPGNLALVSSVNGFGLYRYDTTDAATVVDDNGYFSNNDDELNLAVGDIVEVVVWSSAVRTGTISDVSRHIVMAVDSAGDVNLSNDFLGATVSSSD
jgi:protein involved in polysaccharide export with SLBB domain